METSVLVSAQLRKTSCEGVALRGTSHYVLFMGDRRQQERRVSQLDHDPASLVWVRKQAGITQGSLAKQLGISIGHMSEIESGKRNLTPANMTKAAKLLGCPRAVLVRKYAAPPAAEDVA